MRAMIMLLALAASATAASAQIGADWRTSGLSPGSWAYRETTTGSEAVFTDAGATRRLVVKCSRATRRVSLSVASPTAASALAVATTETERRLTAAFDPQGFQIVAEVGAQDPLLDAIAVSRGRFAITVPGRPALILPAWPEIARSIEDCRV